MAKQAKIKDIAQMAGVSAGTVDRILHNRGNVSAKSKEAVERVLMEVGYRHNIHASAISFRKTFRIVITMPESNPGEYWGTVRNGIDHALEEYSDIDICCHFLFYNQFDLYSCREAYRKVAPLSPDAVIIGPTYIDETVKFCRTLEAAGIPYIYVDTAIHGTSPLATFTTNQRACGELTAKILHMSIETDSAIAIFKAERTDNRSTSSALEREQGFMDYLNSVKAGHKIRHSTFSVLSPEKNITEVTRFLKENPDVKGILVPNSRGHIIADILHEQGFNDIRLVSFDLTDKNIESLERGQITALLCQRPEQQGFDAIKTLIRHMLYNKSEECVHHFMPIDVVFKENLPYYKVIIQD